MSKFNSVLSDEEMHNILALDNDVFFSDSDGNFYTKDGHYSVDTVDLFHAGRKLEQAVLAKTHAEQEPVAYIRTLPKYIDAACNPSLYFAEHVGDISAYREGVSFQPLYTHPCPSNDRQKGVEYAKDAIIGAIADGQQKTVGKIRLEVELSTKEAQETIQGLVDAVDGYQLVPKQPTAEMLKAGVELAMKSHLNGSYTWNDYMRDLYKVMSSEAPNLLGENDG